MSWSFQAVGSAEKVAEALEAHSEKISKNPADASRVEFEEAKPHLVALVKQNFAREGSGYTRAAVRINASGSASTLNGEKQSSSCLVQIENLYGFLG